MQSKIVMTTLLVGGLLILSSCSNNAQKNQGKNGKVTSTNVRDSVLLQPPPPTLAPPRTKNTPDRNGVYEYAQQMPHFPGGTAALMKYLIQNTEYPPKAKENEVHGTVLVEFIVNKNGSISDIKVVSKKHGDGLEE